MLVDLDQELTVTETFTLGRFGEVVLSSGGRLITPTNVVAPGAPAIAMQAANDRNRIVLDDGDNRQNLDPTLYPTGGLSAKTRSASETRPRAGRSSWSSVSGPTASSRPRPCRPSSRPTRGRPPPARSAAASRSRR